jgi:hypothetical protein
MVFVMLIAPSISRCMASSGRIRFKVGINPDEIKFSWDRNYDSKGTVWRLAAKWRRRLFRVASIASL